MPISFRKSKKPKLQWRIGAIKKQAADGVTFDCPTHFSKFQKMSGIKKNSKLVICWLGIAQKLCRKEAICLTQEEEQIPPFGVKKIKIQKIIEPAKNCAVGLHNQ